jgi:hypothetical protein
LVLIGSFGHLDDDFLPLFQQVFDAGAAAGARRVGGVLVLVVGGRLDSPANRRLRSSGVPRTSET